MISSLRVSPRVVSQSQQLGHCGAAQAATSRLATKPPSSLSNFLLASFVHIFCTQIGVLWALGACQGFWKRLYASSCRILRCESLLFFPRVRFIGASLHGTYLKLGYLNVPYIDIHTVDNSKISAVRPSASFTKPAFTKAG